MATLKATFKVHRAPYRGHADPAKATEERVVLHPVDAHEPGASDLTKELNSGNGQIKLTITAEAALGKFVPGQLVEVSFDIPD
jgi:hypothetical protein